MGSLDPRLRHLLCQREADGRFAEVPELGERVAFRRVAGSPTLSKCWCAAWVTRTRH